MAIKIPRSLVEFILLGPEDDRRQLQDSPILGDVWVEYAKKPADRLELLITPYKENAAAIVASSLRNALNADLDRWNQDHADAPRQDLSTIAYLQGVVAASLTFEEVLRFVVPMTSWWSDRRIATAMKGYIESPTTMEQELEATRQEAIKWLQDEVDVAIQDLPTRKRYAALAGLILWAAAQEPASDAESGPLRDQSRRFLERVDVSAVASELKRMFQHMLPRSGKPVVWTIALNRRVHPALTKSVPAVKADAARTLFTVDCREIVWAVIDSGIDASHLSFMDRAGEVSRVVKTFDFTRIRDIVTLDNLTDSTRRRKRVDRILDSDPSPRARVPVPLKNDNLSADEVARRLEALAEAAEAGRSIDWRLVEDLVELKPTQSPPATNHGTHVAGILAASREGARAARDQARKAQRDAPVAPPGPSDDAGSADWADGICPDIRLYDFRVLAPTLKETEFAVIAALQYIRHINERNSWMTIHGANLSLSIPHDVRNYACGRTPVCNECERLVNSGVVVVAAAGNRGYQNFETTEGLYESYAAFSVTDPGNADGVITVGATHRYWPHTYGVSFFSSRGPTGDGRLKPDLVAPGERIRAPIPGNEWGDLDGTSMASPHVSGAAAMLMARYSELVGQPRRIKQVLCQSATDLGRERTFQGHGMLDVLRAFQSI
jgi:serine protease AprX